MLDLSKLLNYNFKLLAAAGCKKTINTTKEAVKNASGYSYDKNDGVWNPL